MRAFLIFTVFLAAASAEHCYKEIEKACDPTSNKADSTPINCNAKYGAIDGVQSALQKYVNDHIERSFEYLLMSTHYANYEKSREGFEKLFRGFSDSKWNTAIDLIKYITKRGGQMRFPEIDSEISSNEDYEMYELQSLAKSLDIEKTLAVEAHNIHGLAARRRNEFHDPEISSFIEEKFVHKQADDIRALSGHVADLTKLLDGRDSSLSLYLFDEYLQKL
ncbi:unnamed protein product [Brassicogethes aeneus]|uniref:Ferritin n=1 Tax=Brassicogethes aeneus TaxID=1431903 RepID=A0A9P0FM50_BRAAE|nr:unnamed protein product [Brassicogethes aeneus]